MVRPNNNKNIKNEGDNGINNTGDNAHIGDKIYFETKSINRSYLYDFCLKFVEVEDPVNRYSTETPTDIDDKMDYNEIILYKDLFSECDHHYEDVENVLNEIPKRERILSKINNKYKRLKHFTAWQDKDELCEALYCDLIKTIDGSLHSQEIHDEDKELAILSLMYYAFVKCKLLDPIP